MTQRPTRPTRRMVQEMGGSVSTSLVLGGPDVLGAAEAQHVLMQEIPSRSPHSTRPPTAAGRSPRTASARIRRSTTP